MKGISNKEMRTKKLLAAVAVFAMVASAIAVVGVISDDSAAESAVTIDISSFDDFESKMADHYTITQDVKHSDRVILTPNKSITFNISNAENVIEFSKGIDVGAGYPVIFNIDSNLVVTKSVGNSAIISSGGDKDGKSCADVTIRTSESNPGTLKITTDGMVLSGAGKLTVENLKLIKIAAGGNYAAISLAYHAVLDIKNTDIDTNRGPTILSRHNAVSTITGGEFVASGNVFEFIGDSVNKICGDAKVNGTMRVDNSSVTITGGTFDYDVTEYVAEGYKCTQSGSDWIVSFDPSAHEAKIGNIYYLTLEAAIEAATDGATIEVMKTAIVENLRIDKDIELVPGPGLAGAFFNTTTGKTITITEGKKLTLSETPGDVAIRGNENSHIVLEKDAKIVNNTADSIAGGNHFVMKAGSSITSKNATVSGYFEMTGATVEAKNICVYAADLKGAAVDGMTVKSSMKATDMFGVYAGSATSTIDGMTIKTISVDEYSSITAGLITNGFTDNKWSGNSSVAMFKGAGSITGKVLADVDVEHGLNMSTVDNLELRNGSVMRTTDLPLAFAIDGKVTLKGTTTFKGLASPVISVTAINASELEFSEVVFADDSVKNLTINLIGKITASGALTVNMDTAMNTAGTLSFNGMRIDASGNKYTIDNASIVKLKDASLSVTNAVLSISNLSSVVKDKDVTNSVSLENLKIAETPMDFKVGSIVIEGAYDKITGSDGKTTITIIEGDAKIKGDIPADTTVVINKDATLVPVETVTNNGAIVNNGNLVVVDGSTIKSPTGTITNKAGSTMDVQGTGSIETADKKLVNEAGSTVKTEKPTSINDGEKDVHGNYKNSVYPNMAEGTEYVVNGKVYQVFHTLVGLDNIDVQYGINAGGTVYDGEPKVSSDFTVSIVPLSNVENVDVKFTNRILLENDIVNAGTYADKLQIEGSIGVAGQGNSNIVITVDVVVSAAEFGIDVTPTKPVEDVVLADGTLVYTTINGVSGYYYVFDVAAKLFGEDKADGMTVTGEGIVEWNGHYYIKVTAADAGQTFPFQVEVGNQNYKAVSGSITLTDLKLESAMNLKETSQSAVDGVNVDDLQYIVIGTDNITGTLFYNTPGMTASQKGYYLVFDVESVLGAWGGSSVKVNGTAFNDGQVVLKLGETLSLTDLTVVVDQDGDGTVYVPKTYTVTTSLTPSMKVSLTTTNGVATLNDYTFTIAPIEAFRYDSGYKIDLTFVNDSGNWTGKTIKINGTPVVDGKYTWTITDSLAVLEFVIDFDGDDAKKFEPQTFKVKLADTAVFTPVISDLNEDKDGFTMTFNPFVNETISYVMTCNGDKIINVPKMAVNKGQTTVDMAFSLKDENGLMHAGDYSIEIKIGSQTVNKSFVIEGMTPITSGFGTAADVKAKLAGPEYNDISRAISSLSGDNILYVVYNWKTVESSADVFKDSGLDVIAVATAVTGDNNMVIAYYNVVEPTPGSEYELKVSAAGSDDISVSNTFDKEESIVVFDKAAGKIHGVAVKDILKNATVSLSEKVVSVAGESQYLKDFNGKDGYFIAFVIKDVTIDMVTFDSPYIEEIATGKNVTIVIQIVKGQTYSVTVDKDVGEGHQYNPTTYTIDCSKVTNSIRNFDIKIVDDRTVTTNGKENTLFLLPDGMNTEKVLKGWDINGTMYGALCYIQLTDALLDVDTNMIVIKAVYEDKAPAFQFVNITLTYESGQGSVFMTNAGDGNVYKAVSYQPAIVFVTANVGYMVDEVSVNGKVISKIGGVDAYMFTPSESKNQTVTVTFKEIPVAGSASVLVDIDGGSISLFAHADDGNKLDGKKFVINMTIAVDEYSYQFNDDVQTTYVTMEDGDCSKNYASVSIPETIDKSKVVSLYVDLYYGSDMLASSDVLLPPMSWTTS